MTHDISTHAAAELYRLAQAYRLLRLYREAHDRDCTSLDDLKKWVVESKLQKSDPTPEDFDRASRENQHLVVLAVRS